MTIIRTYPYSLLFVVAGIVLISLVLFARDHSTPAGGYGPTIAVSTNGTLIDPGISSVNPLTNAPPPLQIGQPSTDSTPYVPIIIGQTGPAQTLSTPANEHNPPSVAAPTHTPASPPPSESDQLLNYVYSLIPSGTATPVALKPRTPTQQALFAYGNEAGQIVLAFDDAHIDMAQVLTDWFADRGSAASNVASNATEFDSAGAQAIAHDMQTAGTSLAALEGVPSAATAANEALAKGYRDAGDRLLVVIKSGGGSDAELVEAMKSYNATADSYVSAFVSLATMFSLYGVTFGSGDAGSAFAFPASSF